MDGTTRTTLRAARRVAALAGAIALAGAALPPASAAAALFLPQLSVAFGGGVTWPPAELGFGLDGTDVDGAQSSLAGVIGARVLPYLAVEGRGSRVALEELDSIEILHYEGCATLLPVRFGPVEPFATLGLGGVQVTRWYGRGRTFAWSAGAGALVDVVGRAGLRVDVRRVSYKVRFLDESAYRPQTEAFVGLHVRIGPLGG
jgi:hypothetical protein